METRQTAATRDTDRQWMQRAIALAWRAAGRVAPNPAVGAVIVRDGRVVGEGCTKPPGGPHAEIVALQAAGDQARGATLYVTLEPCAHYGRTPPCVEAIVRAGIQRVVVALRDPYPEVDGRGIAALRAAGVEVDVGVEAPSAAEVVAGYLKRLRTGLPEVTLKYAMTLDGRLATRTGHSRWITGPEARRYAHQLRDRHDAILVGVGTVLRDDPELTTRLDAADCGDGGPPHPLRVVLDSRARTPPTARLLSRGIPGRTLIVTTDAAPPDRLVALREAGAELLTVPARCGKVDLRGALGELARRGTNSVLVEGGGLVLGSLFDEALVDRVVVFVAPVLVGGADAPVPLTGRGVATMEEAVRLRDVRVRRLGSDVVFEGRVRPIELPE
ncbi:MAG: bifunctional diaminohydroxyphosphoribosylaminopyrimidine deaminase/5-amino-6-(5-phosphoribosylamino)uracil reductase RibD [Thermomicrobium sp.]|nr:bifunctional diaminohydroxyphosphoribosylaminopyrimidine deaminase/5-amino-6-(5-phosphoribosylamino)uracil reductase RibD [Thermomicrobium sp.]